MIAVGVIGIGVNVDYIYAIAAYVVSTVVYL
jgi:hypothetical protein